MHDFRAVAYHRDGTEELLGLAPELTLAQRAARRHIGRLTSRKGNRLPPDIIAVERWIAPQSKWRLAGAFEPPFEQRRFHRFDEHDEADEPTAKRSPVRPDRRRNGVAAKLRDQVEATLSQRKGL